MDWKNNSVIESVGGYEEFEQLVKRGRQMHDQAVFELIARLLSNAILSLKKIGGILIRKRDHSLGLYLKQQNPA